MSDPIVERVQRNPKYAQLKAIRNRYSWSMTAAMLVVYFGYVLLIAFDKELLAKKVSDGSVLSIGIPLGLGVLVFTIILTAIYVRRANTEFDAMKDQIVREATK